MRPGQRVRQTPRVSDCVVLQWLKLRSEGKTITEIARSCGKTPANVAVLIGRVRSADLRESGEPPEAVNGAYGYDAR